MASNSINKEERSEGISLVFSDDEINIINKVINTIHNEKNKIFFNKTVYHGPFFLIDSLRNGMLKGLKNNDNIDSIIIKSFDKRNAKREDFIEMKIDNVNIFNFLFEWYDWRDFSKDKNTLPEDYEIIYISRIGFNEEQTKAIIFLQIEFENEGNGKIYVLEKAAGKWDIVEIIDLFGIVKSIKWRERK
jgi:hypothetical protein